MRKLCDSVDRFCLQHPRFGIPNLMKFLVGIMAVVFVLDLFSNGYASYMLYFNAELVLQGELWRLVTWMFLPTNGSLFWIFISLSFYYFIGTAIEEYWGSAKFTLFYLSGVVLTVLGVVLTPQILIWMGTPESVLASSTAYFRVYFLGSLAVILYNMGASILQSVGDSRSPMKYLITASITNVVLDLLFIAVLGWGVASAALATIISQILSAALAFGKLMRVQASYRVYWKKVHFDLPMLKQIVTLGIPSGVQNSVISLANVIVQANINAFGASAMAGCGSYSKIEGFAFLPVTCFALALSTFVSQNIGAGRYDRVKSGIKFGLICSPLLAECIGITMYLLAPTLISAFNDKPEVVAFGVNQIHTISLFYCLLAFSHCCAGIMRGIGRPIIPMGIMLAVWCVFRIFYITVTV